MMKINVTNLKRFLKSEQQRSIDQTDVAERDRRTQGKHLVKPPCDTQNALPSFPLRPHLSATRFADSVMMKTAEASTRPWALAHLRGVTKHS
jgi:hypothetical protein